jgi:translation elongation factor EF-Tu-like GTPase
MIDRVWDIVAKADDPAPTITVQARIHLFKTEEGGRKTGMRSGLRPNHNFGTADNVGFYIGQISFPGDDREILPGASAEVTVLFLNAKGLRGHLQVGRRWRIQEGSRLIADAEVLSIE